MKVYLAGRSALAYYRNDGSANTVERLPPEIRSMEEATSSRGAIIDAEIWRLGIGEPSIEHPFEVLLRNKSQRSRSKAVRARVWNARIIPTAFRTVRKDIYVSSPEFTFLQMATRLDLPELVALGMELCGTYRCEVRAPHIDSAEMRYTTVYQQSPLTTPRRLRGFLKSMRTAPGCSRALKALDYVLSNSASPMEAALYLLLCLPRRFGGYALPKPTLNPPITISKSGRKHTLRRSAKPDLYWSDIRLDLEYNSYEFHEENQRAIDSMRRKALERMKVEVIELTPDELISVELFHATALRIAQRFNRRIRSEHEGDFAAKRTVLRSFLFSDVEAKEDETYEPVEKSIPADEQAVGDWDIWVDRDTEVDQDYSDAQEADAWDVIDEWDTDDSWGAEFFDGDDEGLYVFGAGKPRAN